SNFVEELVERSHSRCARSMRAFVPAVGHAVGVARVKICSRLTARVKRGFGHFARKRALAERYGALGERAKFLRFRQRRNQSLVDDERGAEVAQQSFAML